MILAPLRFVCALLASTLTLSCTMRWSTWRAPAGKAEDRQQAVICLKECLDVPASGVLSLAAPTADHI